MRKTVQQSKKSVFVGSTTNKNKNFAVPEYTVATFQGGWKAKKEKKNRK